MGSYSTVGLNDSGVDSSTNPVAGIDEESMSVGSSGGVGMMSES